jgi:hypothetical protein
MSEAHPRRPILGEGASNNAGQIEKRLGEVRAASRFSLAARTADTKARRGDHRHNFPRRFVARHLARSLDGVDGIVLDTLSRERETRLKV